MGSICENIHIKNLILAQAATTTSNIIKEEVPQCNLPLTADFEFLLKTFNNIKNNKKKIYIGNILSEDSFYKDNNKKILDLNKYNILAVDMETAILYYLGIKFKVKTLSLMTVSDNLINNENTTSLEREKSFNDMIYFGLNNI